MRPRCRPCRRCTSCCRSWRLGWCVAGWLIYFRLIADLGAAPALTVTFLIPVFGILWGVIFLGEHVGWHTLVGGLTVLWGTALVTGFSISTVFPGRKPDAA